MSEVKVKLKPCDDSYTSWERGAEEHEFVVTPGKIGIKYTGDCGERIVTFDAKELRLVFDFAGNGS